MLNGTSIDVDGVVFHPGDLITDGSDTFLVANTDPARDEVAIYHFESEESAWVDGHEWVRQWFRLQTAEDAVVWRSAFHETTDVLVDGRLVPHTIDCHLVLVLNRPADHPKWTFCLSWERTLEGWTFPADRSFAKYREFDALLTALETVHEQPGLVELFEWTQNHDAIAELVAELPSRLERRVEERAEEGQYIADNADRLYETFFANAEGTTEDEDASSGESDGIGIEWIPAEDLEDEDS